MEESREGGIFGQFKGSSLGREEANRAKIEVSNLSTLQVLPHVFPPAPANCRLVSGDTWGGGGGGGARKTRVIERKERSH